MILLQDPTCAKNYVVLTGFPKRKDQTIRKQIQFCWESLCANNDHIMLVGGLLKTGQTVLIRPYGFRQFVIFSQHPGDLEGFFFGGKPASRCPPATLLYPPLNMSKENCVLNDCSVRHFVDHSYGKNKFQMIKVKFRGEKGKVALVLRSNCSNFTQLQKENQKFVLSRSKDRRTQKFKARRLKLYQR